MLAVVSQVSHLASRLQEATVEKNNRRTLPETEKLVPDSAKRKYRTSDVERFAVGCGRRSLSRVPGLWPVWN